jgi:hypothetical protein
MAPDYFFLFSFTKSSHPQDSLIYQMTLTEGVSLGWEEINLPMEKVL